MVMTPVPWEDNLLERKRENDLKDLLKTIVAFANSVRPGHVALILVGELDTGAVQGVTDPDNIQKRVRQEVERVYPDIVCRWAPYEKAGKTCVRVEIEASGDTPHFGGPSWVRRGSETVKATDEEFQRLIDIRSSIVRELTQWVGKEITVEREDYPSRYGRWFDPTQVDVYGWPKLIFVNRFWATFEYRGAKQSEPLRRLSLSWDDQKDRLKVIINFTKDGPD
jgi:hypothetical protein